MTLPGPGGFAWAVGLEDTFVPQPHPRTGRVLMKRLAALRDDTLQQREREYLARLQRGGSGEIEIFRTRR